MQSVLCESFYTKFNAYVSYQDVNSEYEEKFPHQKQWLSKFSGFFYNRVGVYCNLWKGLSVSIFLIFDLIFDSNKNY